VTDLGGGQLNESEQARLIRITADQVVSNVLQRALLRLLREVEADSAQAQSEGRRSSGSGLKVEQIMEALDQLKMDSESKIKINTITDRSKTHLAYGIRYPILTSKNISAALQEDNKNPYNINNEILRLWTPTVLSRTLDMTTVQAGPSGFRAEGASTVEEILSSGIKMPGKNF